MSEISLGMGVLIGLGIVGLVIVLVRAFGQRRIKLMKAAGAALGLVPLVKDEGFAFVSVELMRKRGRGIGVCLSGNWKGYAVHVFDLFYPSGKSVSIQTVLMTRFNDRAFSEFAAIEKNVNLHWPTVDLPLAEDAPGSLKRHWLLYARNSRWPFGAALAEWMGRNRGRSGLLSSGWSYEGHGTSLYVYRRGATAKPKKLGLWLDEAVAEAQGFALRADAPSDKFTSELEFPTPERAQMRAKATFRVK